MFTRFLADLGVKRDALVKAAADSEVCEQDDPQGYEVRQKHGLRLVELVEQLARKTRKAVRLSVVFSVRHDEKQRENEEYKRQNPNENDHNLGFFHGVFLADAMPRDYPPVSEHGDSSDACDGDPVEYIA